MGRVSIVGVPSSAGSYAAGQEQAPAALRAAGLIEALIAAGLGVHDDGDLPKQTWKPDRAHPYAQNLDQVATCLRELTDRLSPLLSTGDTVLVLGGKAFDERARRLVTGFSAPGAMERMMQLPTGPAPGSQCIQVAVGESFVHGWDVATATGQQMPPDQGVAEAVLTSEWPSMCADVRNGHPSILASEIPVPADAPAVDRLVGFLGRDPNWIGRS
jgi:hypothetical protein